MTGHRSKLLAAVTCALACVGGPAPAFALAVRSVKRYYVSIQGAQVTRWQEPTVFTGGDCFHRNYEKGAGYERVAVTPPVGKLVIWKMPFSRGMPFFTTGTWNPLDSYHRPWQGQIVADRYGSISQTTIPGPCGGSNSTHTTGPYDCGRLSGNGGPGFAYVTGSRTRIKLEFSGMPQLYNSCPLFSAPAVEPEQVTSLDVNVPLNKLLSLKVGRAIVANASKSFPFTTHLDSGGSVSGSTDVTWRIRFFRKG